MFMIRSFVATVNPFSSAWFRPLQIIESGPLTTARSRIERQAAMFILSKILMMSPIDT
jgi:hypothetical protein